MRGDGGNCHEKMGLKRILYGTQFTISGTAGTAIDPAGKNPYMRSSKPILASHTPGISYLLLSSILFPSSSPISLSTPLSQNTMSSHPYQFIHALIMSSPRVPHTASTAYPEYHHTMRTSICRVQHPPKIVCLPFILTITSWPQNVTLTSGVHTYMIDDHQPALHVSLQVKSLHHIPTVAS